MPVSDSRDNIFLEKLTEIIDDNISNEKFGVSELAREMNMSRSNLLRKVKKISNLSVSQFIRNQRLKQSLEILKESEFTVSEVSYKVGFSSTSYFIKCFREYYGYPPGEAGKREIVAEKKEEKNEPETKRKIITLVSTLIIILIPVIIFLIIKPFSFQPKIMEKSIAVLPFKNDSNDSSNVYIINGLMDAVLNNFQKIEELKVISRTSSEKYRNTAKIIPEIAKELNVNYILEGSGQKIGDEILLNVQLIEARTDKHLWAEQYNREVKDIFKLQNEIAKIIANEIEVYISPEEEKRIEKIPTDDLVAYDYFLQGMDYLHKRETEDLKMAISFFEKAIEQDSEFARAHAAMAITYYFLDVFKAEKKYTDLINNFADKAMFLDSELPQSLVAKALFYISTKEYELAESYLEKALEYKPNYDLALAFLVDLYVNYIPNTEKYLEYALKGIQVNVASYDSITQSMIFLHISNSFIQNGFVDEAEKYINKSLEYYTGGLYAEYVKAYILYAKHRNLETLKNELVKIYNQDTTRNDVLQEVGKCYYFLRDYEKSWYYYKKFVDIKNALNLDVYNVENAKIAAVLSELGMNEKAGEFFKMFKEYADNDISLYKDINLAMYYSYMGDTAKAIHHLNLFASADNFHYWTIILVPIDPLIDNIKELPKFKTVFKELENRFDENYKRLHSTLENKGLI